MRINPNEKPKDELGRTIDLDALVQKFAVDVETFDVELPSWGTLTFRPIGRVAEQKAIYAAAAAMYSGLPKPGTPAEDIHPWKGSLPANMDEFFSAFLISEMSVEPTKIPHLTALKLLKAPHLIEYLQAAIEENSKTLSSLRFAERVQEAKKNLIENLSNGSESDVPGSASKGIQRSSAKRKKNSSPNS